MKREVEASAKRVDAKINIQAKINLDRSVIAGELAKLRTQLAASSGDITIKAKIKATESALKDLESGVGGSIDKGVNNSILGKGRGGKIFAGVLAAFTAGAPLLGSAIVGGLGTAGIGVGIAAAIQNPATKSAITDLGAFIKLEFQQAALPFNAEIVKTVPIIKSAFASIQPDLSKIFSSLAPSLSQLATGFSGFLQQAMPGITAATTTAIQLFSTLADMLPGVGSSVGGFFQVLAEHSEGIKTGIVFAVNLLKGVVDATAGTLSGLLTVFDPVIGALGSSASAFKALGAIILAGAVGWKTYQVAAAATTAIMAAGPPVLAAISAGYALLTGAEEAAAVAAGELAVAEGAATLGLAPLIGLVVSGAVGLGVFGSAMSAGSDATKGSIQSQNDFKDALIKSNGAIDEQVKLLQIKKLNDSGLTGLGEKLGITPEALTKAFIGGPEDFQKVLDTQQARLNRLKEITDESGQTKFNPGESAAAYRARQEEAAGLNKTKLATEQFIKAGNDLLNQYRTGAIDAATYRREVAALGPAFDTAKRAAEDNKIAFAQASQAFKDQQTSLKEAVTSTAEAVTSAYQGITDANHSVLLANRSLADSISAIGKAERTLVKDHDAEKQAQLDLTSARKAAAQQLEDLKKQVRDSVNSTEEAKIRLIEANIAEQQSRGLPADSLDREKAVLAQREAQQAYNDSLVAGKKTTQDYNDARKKGIEGNQGVIDAHKNVKGAQQQTHDDEIALTKAHEAQTEAEYNLTKAHQAVTTAQRNYTTAVKNHNKAVQNASISLDINTVAGDKNATALLGVWDAYVKMNPDQATSLTQFAQQAALFGLNKTEAENLGKSIGLIPDKTIVITTQAALDFTKLIGLTGSDAATVANAFSQFPTGAQQRQHQGKATGGLIHGPGTGTSDSVPIWASSNEYVVRAAAVEKLGINFMDYINTIDKHNVVSGDPSAARLKFAAGGSVPDVQKFLHATAGKPYVFGAVGPNAFDCSGLVGEVWARLTGHSSNHRYFYTGNEEKFFKPGRGTFTVGLSGEHTVGNLDGLAFEAAHTGAPIRVGSSATSVNKLPKQLYLPGVKSGKGTSGSAPSTSTPSVAAPTPITSIDANDLAQGINVLKLMGIGVTQDQAVAGIFNLFGIPFKTTTSFSKPGGKAPVVLPSPGKGNYQHRAFAEAANLSATTQQMLALFETANVESNWKNYANRNVPSSLKIPHDAVGDDHYSVGILQQQVGVSGTGSGYGWGNVAHAMSIEGATDAFIQHAKRHGTYSSAGKLAQAVQVSGFPDRYDKEEGLARAQLRSMGAKGYDQGGWLTDSPGINNTGKPEAVLTPDESAGLKAAVNSTNEVRLDTYSIQRLAQAIAMMKFDLHIDGKPVAVAMTPHFNKQFASSGF